MGRRSLAGSAIGGIRETQEMLDYCAEHNIVSDIELIPIQKINAGVRAHAEERREVSLRDRHGVAEGVTLRLCGAMWCRRPACSATRQAGRLHHKH